MQVLEPEDVRAAFDLAFRRFGQSINMLLPDRRALAYHADMRWPGKIRGTARARYRDDGLDISGCGEKVRMLIADAVAAEGIQVLVKEVQLLWQKDDLQRQMRSRIKRQLRASGVEADAVESLAAGIVDLAKMRTDR